MYEMHSELVYPPPPAVSVQYPFIVDTRDCRAKHHTHHLWRRDTQKTVEMTHEQIRNVYAEHKIKHPDHYDEKSKERKIVINITVAESRLYWINKYKPDFFTTKEQVEEYLAGVIFDIIEQELAARCWEWKEEEFIKAVGRADLHYLDPPNDADPSDYSPYEQYVCLKEELKKDFNQLVIIMDQIFQERPLSWSVSEAASAC